MANIIHSREGVTQGYPLDMVAYGIRIFPMRKRLKLTQPDVTQSWYAKNSGELGTFDHLERYFKALNRNGPARGYLPEPTKIILVVHSQKLKAGYIFYSCHGFKVCTGARYPGGHIGDDESKGYWLK